jgi:hypothetical protein
MVFVVLGGSLLLIPRWGTLGAALAILIQRASFLTILSVLGLRRMRRP